MCPDYALEPFTDHPVRSTMPVNTPPDDGRTNFRTSVIALDRPGDASVFDEKTHAEVQTIIAKYPPGKERSALGPILHLVQSIQGQVTPDGIAFAADHTGLTKAQVAAFATFYTMYKRTPTGEYLVSVCTNTLCGVLGGDEIFAALKDELGIGNNQTTSDGSITLEHAECLAACDYAPVVTVNYEFFDNQTIDSAKGLVRELRNGQRPLPSRGAPLCTFKQISRQIAGFYDDDNATAPDSTATGAPTERGVVLALSRGETAPSYAATDTSTAGYETDIETAHADQQPDNAGDYPLETKEDEAAAARNPGQGPSQNDAPLKTAESDPAHPAEPGD